MAPKIVGSNPTGSARKREKMKRISKIKCKICGKKFPITAGDRYCAREAQSVSTLLVKPVTYECFDCIYCGCQNIVGVREPKVDDV